MELLEVLELYCELLIARFGLLDQKYVRSYLSKRKLSNQLKHLLSNRDPDPAVSEGVCCVIHAAPRTELKGKKMPPFITLKVSFVLAMLRWELARHCTSLYPQMSLR